MIEGYLHGLVNLHGCMKVCELACMWDNRETLFYCLHLRWSKKMRSVLQVVTYMTVCATTKSYFMWRQSREKCPNNHILGYKMSDGHEGVAVRSALGTMKIIESMQQSEAEVITKIIHVIYAKEKKWVSGSYFKRRCHWYELGSTLFANENTTLHGQRYIPRGHEKGRQEGKLLF